MTDTERLDWLERYIDGRASCLINQHEMERVGGLRQWIDDLQAVTEPQGRPK